MPAPAATVTADTESALALRWLVRLRWWWVGAVVLLVLGSGLFNGSLPAAPLLLVAGLIAGSNLAAPRLAMARLPVVPPLILLDVALLTVALAVTGGAANPFSALYIVHVAVAAMALGALWAWLVVGLSTACYATLFELHAPLSTMEMDHAMHHAASQHLSGMWVAYVVVSALVTWFIGRMRAELRMRDADLTRVRALVARQERLTALTTLAAGAAHELATPLGTIAIAATELARTLPPDDAARADAGLIRDEVDRCRLILDRMSGSAARQQDDATRLPLVDWLAELVAGLPPALADRVTATHAGEGSLARSLMPAIRPLLDNAAAADPAGAIALTAAGPEADGPGARVTVTDCGPGMSPETLARAGEPFFTTRDPGHGMGLGLFLARLIAERHSGRLSLRSTPGSGTTATIELPAP